MPPENNTGLTEAEQKYFDTKGAVAPEGVVDTAQPAESAKAVETPKAAETPKTTEKPAEAADAEPEALKVVDKRALDEERNRRKELQKQNAEMRANLERLTGRLEGAGLGNQPKKPDAPLDPVNQPIEVLGEHDKFIREFRQREEQKAQMDSFVGQYATYARDFASKTPDFAEAYNFLLKDRSAELQESFGLSGIALENALRNNEMEIAAVAMQQGANPAERIYQLAKRRGYTGAKPADPAVEMPDPAKATAEVLAKATNTLATIAKGQEKSKSLSTAGGSGADGVPSTEELVAMDNDEFDKLTKNPRAWKKIAGGA